MYGRNLATIQSVSYTHLYMNLLVFAMLFNGGLVPTFLALKEYHLLNTIWALILPGAVPIFNVILLMNFMMGIPKSLEEAAILDGANPVQVLTRVYLPCSVPVIATVALFSIVGSWNDFYTGLMYITRINKYPLMTYIQSITINMEDIIRNGTMEEILRASQVSQQNLNAAKIVVAVVPLLLIYPLLQKYFITGIVDAYKRQVYSRENLDHFMCSFIPFVFIRTGSWY